MSAPPDAAAVLAGLKDFQRATVDYSLSGSTATTTGAALPHC